jgi:acetyl coenzyme A synthetase (ADP forming)-like protein
MTQESSVGRPAPSLRPLLCPKSVAVVGASRNPASIGFRVLDGMLKAGFAGPVYPVNPRADAVLGRAAYPSVRVVPGPVDLAVITTPRDAVLPVLEDCAAHGVRAVVVITAGFAEVGPDGRELQERIVRLLNDSRMRMVGPNCLGLINADAAVRLNASFSPIFPAAGPVAMSSQSGAVGLAALGAAGRYGMGFSTFVSVGNKADVSGNDLLEYWEQDEATRVILLYLESFGNPRRFARIARRVGRTKPIVAIKSGRSKAGGRAAGSHTAALAAREVAVDALFHQSGVIRVDTLEELFDVAIVLANQPLPAGPRIAVVTNAGGPGILAADAAEACGLQVPPPTPALRARLGGILPSAAGLSNPIDMIATATPEQFRATIDAVLQSGEFDALLVEYVDVGMFPLDAITTGIRGGVDDAARAGAKPAPVLGCLMTAEGTPARTLPGPRPMPLFAFPEPAVRALGHAARYAEWKSQPPGTTPGDATEFAAAGHLFRAALADRGPGWLTADECRRALRDAGFRLPGGGTAVTDDQAVTLARSVGYPVALKLSSRSLLHKTEVGGVRLDLMDDAAVKAAFEDIRRRAEQAGPAGAFEGVIVQPMIRDAVEVVLGMTHDPAFGPLIMFGLGGIHVELLADVCFRITPLTDRDAAEMVRSIRGVRLLEGYRGHPRADIAALEQLLLRLSGLVEAVPEIQELDLNPVMALADGYAIVDARIRVGPPVNGPAPVPSPGSPASS